MKSYREVQNYYLGCNVYRRLCTVGSTLQELHGIILDDIIVRIKMC